MNNLKIIINDHNIHFSKYSPFVSTIFYIDYDGQFFPDNQWTDFTDSVLSMWTYNLIENLHKHKAKFTLPFMDGPYRMDVVKEQENLTINCVNFRKNQLVVFSIYCSYVDFLKVVREGIRSWDNVLHKAWTEGKLNNKISQSLFNDCRFLIEKLDDASSGKP